MKLNYDQYLLDLHQAYVGRVATITGAHSQAGRTGRITAIRHEIDCERVAIQFFSPAEPREALVRLNNVRIEPIPA